MDDQVGRSSACFFESLRAWISCRQSPAMLGPARYRSSLGESASSWVPPSTFRSKLRALVAQGLLHSVFFTVGFVCFPSIYVIYSVIPMVSREWAIDMARWIGLRSIIQTEEIIKLILEIICISLLTLTLVTLLATALVDPGRVPKKYHWITTAVRCALVAPLSSVPPSQRRLTVAQSLGLGVNDVAAHDMTYHSSSFCPSLHQGGALVSRGSGPRLCDRDDSNVSEEAAKLKRKSRIYMSYKSVRVWQALLLSEDRASLWSVTPHEDSTGDFSSHKGADLDLEIPTDLNGLCDGVKLRLKWCGICQHVRLPRTRHCTSCQCCVDRFDHHCVWVCNCVGLRNHRYFVAFVFFACTLNCVILMLCIALYHELWQQTYHQLNDSVTEHWWNQVVLIFEHHWILIKMIPVVSTLLVLTFLLFFPLVNLILFHAVLVASNRTTTEEMRELYLIKNPFSLGCKGNLYQILWAPVPPSMTDRWGQPKQLSNIDIQPTGGVDDDGECLMTTTTDMPYGRTIHPPRQQTSAPPSHRGAITRDTV